MLLARFRLPLRVRVTSTQSPLLDNNAPHFAGRSFVAVAVLVVGVRIFAIISTIGCKETTATNWSVFARVGLN